MQMTNNVLQLQSLPLGSKHGNLATLNSRIRCVLSIAMDSCVLFNEYQFKEKGNEQTISACLGKMERKAMFFRYNAFDECTSGRQCLMKTNSVSSCTRTQSE